MYSFDSRARSPPKQTNISLENMNTIKEYWKLKRKVVYCFVLREYDAFYKWSDPLYIVGEFYPSYNSKYSKKSHD